MGYVDSVLQPNETIVYGTRLSWVAYLPALVLAVVAMLLAAAASGFGYSFWGTTLGLIVLIYALCLFLIAWFDRWTTEIAITNRRIILKKGFIRRDTIEMSVEKVESVDVQQSLLGRLLDYGDIVVRGTGVGFAPMRRIEKPLEFRSHVTAR